MSLTRIPVGVGGSEGGVQVRRWAADIAVLSGPG
jgi:hypothetical protein